MLAVRRSGRTLDRLLEGVTLFPQTLINVRLRDGADWTANADLAGERERAERELGKQGRVLIRASGTEPVLRVMVEASEATLARHWAQRLRPPRRPEPTRRALGAPATRPVPGGARGQVPRPRPKRLSCRCARRRPW